ncbi:MAG: hypothetical protein KKD74_04985, partial [Bacteroidetes bacterium]|nr:hypothetical protein [Bacteroidota bacterium]
WVSGEGKKPGIYVKEVKYHFNGWKGDISSGFTADGESEVINRFIPFSGRENGETPSGGGANFDNSSLALDIGGGIYGGLRTAVTSGDQWLGNNGKYYNKSWGGNQYTGSRSGAIAASNTYKWAGRATVGAIVIIGGIQVYNGYQMDRGQFGYNANLAGASATGSIVGGWAGAKAGASIGFGIGVWIGGAGAIPCTIIGGFVGGLIGSFSGSYIGESSVNYYYGR